MSDMLPSPAELRAMSSSQAAACWAACEDRDEAHFARWLCESDDNRAAWRKAERVWALFDDADDDAMIAAMARAARQAGPDADPAHAPDLVPANDRAWGRSLAAAVAIFVVVSGIMFGLQGRFGVDDGATRIASAKQGDPLTRFGTADYVTGSRQESVVDLSDGTRITLAADSALDVAYRNIRRDVRLLKGHAFFEVAHDAARPFEVEAAGRTVTAIGTRFHVILTKDEIQVALAQGSVSIRPTTGAGRPVRLRPGETFTAYGDKPGTVRGTSPDPDRSGLEGFAAFDDQPLSVVVERLNRTTRAQIVIRDPKVAAMRVTGQFRTGDVARFDRALELVLPVRIVARQAERYEIVARR